MSTRHSNVTRLSTILKVPYALIFLVLINPSFDYELLLQSDDSERGASAILSQYNGKGCDHPIAYYSRKLPP